VGTVPDGAAMLDVVHPPAQQAFGNAKRGTLPQYCLDCDVRFACKGCSPKDRFDATPDGEPGLHHRCAGYRAFFRHVDTPMRAPRLDRASRRRGQGRASRRRGLDRASRRRGLDRASRRRGQAPPGDLRDDDDRPLAALAAASASLVLVPIARADAPIS
jgi:uncharacterized protein